MGRVYIAIKLSKQINKVTDLLRRSLLTYNEMGSTLVFDEIKDPNSPFYGGSTSAGPTTTPASIRQQLIDTLCLKERCKEEIAFVKQEMIQLFAFYHKQIDHLFIYLNTLQSNSLYSQGIKALVGAKILTISLITISLVKLWEDLKDVPYHMEAVQSWATLGDVPPLKNSEDVLEDDECCNDESCDDYCEDDTDMVITTLKISN